jgi:hypothetical protein
VSGTDGGAAHDGQAEGDDRKEVAMSRKRLTVLLLGGGILAPIWYVLMNWIAAVRFPGYSTVDQTISELSAIGAPSRTLWVRLGIAYTVFLVAFGIGVWLAANGRRVLRVTGVLLAADAVFGIFWPPMHLRGTETSLTDTLHIVWTGVSIPTVLVAIGFAAFAFGKRFRVYSFVTVAAMLGFGGLTGMYGPRIPEGLATPFIGVYERIGAAAFMAWWVVLAVMLIREQGTRVSALKGDVRLLRAA